MSETALSDTWSSRDLPVLRAAARMLESDDGRIDVETMVRDLGFSEEMVERSLAALSDSGAYLRFVRPERLARSGSILNDLPWHGWYELTERGRRTVGLWPSGDLADALVDALRQAEQTTSDPAEQSRLRNAAGALLSVSRDVMVDVLAAAVTRQSGLG